MQKADSVENVTIFRALWQMADTCTHIPLELHRTLPGKGIFPPFCLDEEMKDWRDDDGICMNHMNGT